MFTHLTGTTQKYLANLERNQLSLQQAQAQISSGVRVGQPSDDPAAVAEILQVQAAISRNQQIQSNLGGVKTEVDSADSALQTAVQAVENAISLAAQGATSTADAQTRANLAEQIRGLQEVLVGISQTTVNGRYIFSGDQDSQAPYQLDASQPNGVKQLVTGAATRVIQSVDGTSFAVARTAQQIFDDPSASVFGSIQALRTALTNNDTAGITAAASSLKTADTQLNSQLAFYGQVENRVQEATSLAQKFQTQQQTELSQVRDTDVPTVAIAISQLQIQQEASMQVEATLAKARNLFDFLA